MTTLLLVRHGQASFGSDDYDRLCEAGVHQSRLLGAHLARTARLPDVAVAGTLRRQGDTARHALAAADHRIPIAADAAFDEYPSDTLFAAYLPVLAAADPSLAGDRSTLRTDRRRFQAALMGVMDLWVTGHAAFVGESWTAFHSRVRQGLDAAVAGRDKDATIAVFTSGGVIATAIGIALGLPARAAVALSWRINNASVSELHFGRSGYSLIGFNAIEHLRLAGDAALLSHR